MGWTTPKTDWATGELVTAGDLNTIGDNMVALKNPPTDYYNVDEASNYETTSTSFVDVDSTNLALTITTTGGDVMVGFFATVYSNVTNGWVYFNVEMDGTLLSGDDGLIARKNPDGANPNVQGPISFVVFVPGLSAGSHTFKLQWKVNTNKVYMLAGAGTGGQDLHPQFWVRELS